MPNKSKQKGDRCERQIVKLLRSHGLNAYRVPLSGSCVGFKDDKNFWRRRPGRSGHALFNRWLYGPARVCGRVVTATLWQRHPDSTDLKPIRNPAFIGILAKQPLSNRLPGYNPVVTSVIAISEERVRAPSACALFGIFTPLWWKWGFMRFTACITRRSYLFLYFD